MTNSANSLNEDWCETCKNQGWIRNPNVDWHDQMFGKLEPCPDCKPEIYKKFKMAGNDSSPDPEQKEKQEPTAEQLSWMDYTD